MNWKSDGRNRRGCPKNWWRDNLREELERYNLREIEAEGKENSGIRD